VLKLRRKIHVYTYFLENLYYKYSGQSWYRKNIFFFYKISLKPVNKFGRRNMLTKSRIDTSVSQQSQFTWQTGVNERYVIAYNFTKKTEPKVKYFGPHSWTEFTTRNNPNMKPLLQTSRVKVCCNLSLRTEMKSVVSLVAVRREFGVSELRLPPTSAIFLLCSLLGPEDGGHLRTTRRHNPQ
jgi:hypothetical protein